MPWLDHRHVEDCELGDRFVILPKLDGIGEILVQVYLEFTVDKLTTKVGFPMRGYMPSLYGLYCLVCSSIVKTSYPTNRESAPPASSAKSLSVGGRVSYQSRTEP